MANTRATTSGPVKSAPCLITASISKPTRTKASAIVSSEIPDRSTKSLTQERGISIRGQLQTDE